MTNYFKNTKPEFLQVAKKVWKTLADFTESKRTGSGKRFKSIPNDHKITVTRTGIYTDSYQHNIPVTVDKICRMRASVLCECLLEDLIPSASKKLTSRFNTPFIYLYHTKVQIESVAMRSMFSVMKEKEITLPKCTCCGILAKYVYVEKNITPVEKPNTKRIIKSSYSLAFYGVGTDNIEYRMTVDHIHPKSSGGEDSVQNMQIMCSNCNSLKASIPNDVYMAHREVITNLIAETGPIK